MYARTLYSTGDPAKIDAAVDRLVAEGPALLADLPGYRGLGIFADRQLGKILSGSWWETEQAREDSNEAIMAWRADVVERFAATMALDNVEVMAFERREKPGPGACMRMTRLELDPADSELLADTFRSTTLPRLDSLPGMIGAALFLDPPRGRGSVSVLFRDRDALAASRGAQAAARSDAVAKAHTTVRSLEEFEVVYADIRGA